MHGRRLAGLLVLVAALMGVPTLGGCSATRCHTDFARRDLPSESSKEGGPTITGHIAYQPPFGPVTVGYDLVKRRFFVAVGGQFAVPLVGTFKYSAGVVTAADGSSKDQELQPPAADESQIIVCHGGTADQICDAFELKSGRRLRASTDGHVEVFIERGRVQMVASPGATITITDVSPPRDTHARGPARIAIERVTFNETGGLTELDVERRHSGRDTDLAYDHVTGMLTLINGAEVSRVRTPDILGVLNRDAIPGEQECVESKDWERSFGNEPLKCPLVACLKTAEGDMGYVVIWPHTDKKPVELELYSYVWVRPS